MSKVTVASVKGSVNLPKQYKPRPQELAKTTTEANILKVLTKEKKRVRWSELLKKTKLSSRTLSDRIKDLEQKGAVTRIIDSSVYPPAVYYEATSSAYLTKLPIGSALDQIKHMLEEWRARQRFLDTNISDPQMIINNMVEDYVLDLLFTLNYCMEEEKRTHWPFLAYYHFKAYESRIMELIRVMHKSPKLIEAVKKTYQNFRRKRDKEMEKLLNPLVALFKDKELARSTIKQFMVLLSQGYVKNPSQFLKQLQGKKDIRVRVEERFGKPIDDSRLEAIIADPAWEKIGESIKKKK